MERTVIHRHATRAVSVGHDLLTGASDCARALAPFRVKPGTSAAHLTPERKTVAIRSVA